MLLYMSVAMVALMGMASLAADYGLTQMAKTELQSAVDAAARAAVSNLRSVTNAQNSAVAIAGKNNYVGNQLAAQYVQRNGIRPVESVY